MSSGPGAHVLICSDIPRRPICETTLFMTTEDHGLHDKNRSRSARSWVSIGVMARRCMHPT